MSDFVPAPPKVTLEQIARLRRKAVNLQIYHGNEMCAAKELVEEIDKIIESVEEGEDG